MLLGRDVRSLAFRNVEVERKHQHSYEIAPNIMVVATTHLRKYLDSVRPKLKDSDILLCGESMAIDVPESLESVRHFKVCYQLRLSGCNRGTCRFKRPYVEFSVFTDRY